jgi:ABC-type transport system substrate-binding protein
MERLGDRKPRRLTMLRVWAPRPYLPDPVKVGESIVETCRGLGIEVEVIPTRDAAHYFQQIAAGTADLYLAGWAADTPDPADFLEGVLSSRAIPKPGELSAHGNLGRYASAAMDAALDRYRADPAEARWQAVLDLLREDVPMLSLQYGAAVVAHSWRVRNFTPSPFGWVPLGEVDLRD